VNRHFKSVFTSIKDLLPYVLLISIYFFFINIEARNEKNKHTIIEVNNELEDNNRRIKIPIIQYNE